jgi:uncharacterized protein
MVAQYCSSLEVRRSPINRNGCFATGAIPANAVVCEYTGELIDAAEALRREADAARPGIYTFWVDDEWVIDGLHGGNATIYINHACQPNCYPLSEGRRLFICAETDIGPGEELTLDYSYDAAGPPEPCSCGAAACRGYINEAGSAAGAPAG